MTMVTVVRRVLFGSSLLVAVCVMVGFVSQNRMLHRYQLGTLQLTLLENLTVGPPSPNVKVEQGPLVSVNNNVASETKSSDKMRFVLCTRVRNEAPYLREWIEYHRMIGFDDFIIMNDDSTDDTQCILDAYAQEGIVKRIPQDIDDTVYGRDAVLQTLPFANDRVFDTCANYLSSNVNGPDQGHASRTWMFTSDVDEFLYIAKNETLLNAVTQLIESRSPCGESIVVPRLRFGSSNHVHYEQGLLIERFHKRYDTRGCDRIRIPKKTKGPKGRFANPEQYFCVYEKDTTFLTGKSMSLVSSLATKCFEPVDEKRLPATCNGPHRHTLHNSSFIEGNDGQRSLQIMATQNLNADDVRYMQMEEVAQSMLLLHYGTKSREEFYSRVCDSVWNEKYFRCLDCTPASFFLRAERYLNNYEDRRMAPFVTDLKTRMEASRHVGRQCNEKPTKHPAQYYLDCFEQGKQKRLERVAERDFE